MEGARGGWQHILADRGFVVFVPQNLYRGGENFRILNKKAEGIKASMWSLMIGQHHQILAWLETRCRM